MKSLKLFALGLLAAGSMITAFAVPTNVYITGSSAYRAATHDAIKALFTGASLKYGYSGTDITAATFGIFTGNLVSDGSEITIVTSFSGSAAGIQTIVQTSPVLSIPFIDPSIAAGLSPAGSTNQVSSVSHTADIALSDARVELTPFTRATDLAALEAVGSPVGVIQFYWLKNNGANAAITGVTNQMVKAAGGGSLRLSFFTGNDADTGLVRIVGRNPDSGTRLVAYEEPGYGALKPATQFLPSGATTTTAGSGDITSFTLWPAETVLGISFAAGESGYSSGGTLRDVVKRTSSAGAVITYLGKSDATNAIAGGAVMLAYNGVKPTSTSDNAPFVNGTYSFWSFEHLYYSEAASDTVIQIGDELSTEMQATAHASLSGIPLGDMKVKRSGEGAAIIHK